MAFLDDSGDIILDAVLTDTGRMRLARADGSFRIAKFALGDDEIDYELYDKNNAGGSAYYDLSILQTPVLEAFTNNASSMNSRLLTIPRTNLLFLPIIKLNEADAATTGRNAFAGQAKGSFIVAANRETVEDVGIGIQGMMLGQAPNDAGQTTIQCDQGLDTPEIVPLAGLLDADLIETQYAVEIDNRFGRITNTAGARAEVAFIDDDNIANYRLTTADPTYVTKIVDTLLVGQGSSAVIRGPRGTSLKFRIASSVDIASGNFLFTKFGNTGQSFTTAAGGVATVGTLDTTVRVTGLTTGYRIDIPVRFIRKE